MNTQIMEKIEKTNEILDLVQKLKQLKKTPMTFCGHLMWQFKKTVDEDFEMINATYTSDGTMADFRDKVNGQEYIVEIKVKR